MIFYANLYHIEVTGKNDHANADRLYDTMEADDKGVSWRANLFNSYIGTGCA